jgi:hypothetical protein
MLLTFSKTMRSIVIEFWLSFLFSRTKYVKSHVSPLYSYASLDTNVTGDEDRIVKMWDNRFGDTSIRLSRGLMSLSLAASGEGTIQSFYLGIKKPDIQSEMYDGELNCMRTVRSGT